MPKIFLFLPLIALLASCHAGVHPATATAKGHRFRFNPPDSSQYRYHMTSEMLLSATDDKKSYSIDRMSQFTVHYLITRDSDEFLMEMTFDTIEYHENDPGTGGVDAATTEPVRDLINQMKTTTIFGHVRPSKQLITTGGGQEMVNNVVNSYYAADNKAKAGQFWGQWVEQELVWKNLDPFVWVTLDSGGRPGERWADTSTNEEDIYFKVNKHFWFDKLDAATVTVSSRGQISNGPGGNSLWGKPATGPITGTERGQCLVDTATGMPIALADTINAEGNLQVEGRNTRIKMIKTIKMTGEKVQ